MEPPQLASLFTGGFLFGFFTVLARVVSRSKNMSIAFTSLLLQHGEKGKQPST